MTRQEYESTLEKGAREAAWEISRGRGAHANPERLVSRQWVLRWRAMHKMVQPETGEGRHETQGDTKPIPGGMKARIAGLARNGVDGCRTVNLTANDLPGGKSAPSANLEMIADSPEGGVYRETGTAAPNQRTSAPEVNTACRSFVVDLLLDLDACERCGQNRASHKVAPKVGA